MAASGAAYLDSSAVVKLVVEEAETASLRASLVAWPRLMTSSIVEVEVHRAVRRADGTAEAAAKAREVLATLVFIELDVAVRAVAAALEPPTLRSFDAIHLASALRVADDLVAFVSYDHRLFDAAGMAGLNVVAPGQA